MADHDEVDADEQIAPKDPRYPLKVVYCPGKYFLNCLVLMGRLMCECHICCFR